MKKKMVFIIVIIILLVLFFLIKGFEIHYVVLKMPIKNPTSYAFNVNIDTLKRIIYGSKDDFNKELGGSFVGLYRVFKDSSKLFKIEYLKKSENINDFVYYGYYGSYPLYYNENNESIDYQADFHIHLEEGLKGKTHVKINTCRPRIDIRVRSIISHAPGFWNTYIVEPSTIEEYKILLVIGEKLGIRDKMPKLILPIPPK